MKTKLGLSIFLIIFIFGASVKMVGAIEYGQMGGKPTNFDPNIPDSKAWFIYNLEPGVSKEDSLTVANLFNESWTAVIYAADSIKSSSGGFALRQLTEPKEAVGTWVKFYPEAKPEFANKIFEDKKTIDEACKVSQEDLENKYELDGDNVGKLKEWCEGKDIVELDLKAGEKKELLFVITIPSSAEVGEHTGGILIQKKAKDESAQTDGSKVMLTTRVGVRIYETVPGDIIKKLAFSDFTITKNYNEFYLPWDKIKKDKFREYVISSTVNNGGNVSTDFKENIIIKNLITRKEMRIENREFQVLRGDTFISSFAWKAPFFAYLSFKKEYAYNDAGNGEQKITTDSINKWFIPWREMSFALVGLLIIGASYFFWKKYQKKHYGGENWIDYRVSEGDTVQSLIKKYSVDWKIFVKTNKIKKPFILEDGQMIKVPLIAEEMLGRDEISIKEEGLEEVKTEYNQKLNKDKTENDLSDEDILKRKELFDNSFEEESNKNTDTEKEENINNENIYSVSDEVDSSLFFATNQNKKDEVDKGRANMDVSIVRTGEEKIKNVDAVPKMLKKEAVNDFPEVKISKKISQNEIDSSEEENLLIENDDITIQGTKSDLKGYYKKTIVFLVLLVIFLVGAIVYILIRDSKQKEKNLNENVIQSDIQVSQSNIEEKSVPESENNIVSEDEKEIDFSKIKVDVFNASGVAGAAGKVKDFLVAKKYENVEAKNYSGDNISGSIIYYKEDKLKEEATWIADILKSKNIQSDVKLAIKDEEKSADIVIILGK